MPLFLDILIVASYISIGVSNFLLFFGCYLIFVYYRKREKGFEAHYKEENDGYLKSESLLDQDEMRRFVDLDPLSSYLILLTGYWWLKLPFRPKYTIYVLRGIIVSLIVGVIIGFTYATWKSGSRFDLVSSIWNSIAVLATLGFPVAWKNFNVVAPYLYLCPPTTKAYSLVKRTRSIRKLAIFSVVFSMCVALILCITMTFATSWYFKVLAFPLYSYVFLFISISVVVVGATAVTIHIVLEVLVSDVIFLSFGKKEETQIAHDITTALEMISKMEKTFPIISYAFSRIMLTIWLFLLCQIVNVAIYIVFNIPKLEYLMMPVVTTFVLLVGLVPCAQVNAHTDKFREMITMLLRNAMEVEDSPLLLDIDVGHEGKQHDLFKARTDRCEALWIDLFRFVEQDDATNAADSTARKSSVFLTEEEREMLWRTSQLSSDKLFRMQIFGITVSYSLLWRILSIDVAYATFLIQYFFLKS